MKVARTNNVIMTDCAGGDKNHCISAWCSTFEELGIEIPDTLEDRIDVVFNHVSETKQNSPGQLLEMLADLMHHTPFEKSYLEFQIETDIATHIQLLKHRIGTSISAESARWKFLKAPTMYVPLDWPDDEVEKHIAFCQMCVDEYKRKFKALLEWYRSKKSMTEREAKNRAKESARYVLPYSNQIVCDVAFNWRSFYHFFGLRYSTHAQLEIQQIAKCCLEELIRHKYSEFELTLKAFKLLTEDGNIREPFKRHYMILE